MELDMTSHTITGSRVCSKKHGPLFNAREYSLGTIFIQSAGWGAEEAKCDKACASKFSFTKLVLRSDPAADTLAPHHVTSLKQVIAPSRVHDSLHILVRIHDQQKLLGMSKGRRIEGKLSSKSKQQCEGRRGKQQ